VAGRSVARSALAGPSETSRPRTRRALFSAVGGREAKSEGRCRAATPDPCPAKAERAALRPATGDWEMSRTTEVDGGETAVE